MIDLNKIYNENCMDTMKKMSDNFVDLTVTSPPEDNLRTYEDDVHKTWDDNTWKPIINEIYRVTKKGGVVVWIVGDATNKGSETGTSFKQALWAMICGFRLHDTMIWNKGGFSAVGALKVRYAPVFEYMFIFSKGKIKTFNPIKDRENKHGGKRAGGTIRQKDGSTKPMSKAMTINEYGQRFNIWDIFPQRQKGNNKHPAPFPEQIAEDHIISWSNPNEIIYDPFMGSGTTAKMAVLNSRKYVGSEISKKYCQIAEKRLK